MAITTGAKAPRKAAAKPAVAASPAQSDMAGMLAAMQAQLQAQMQEQMQAMMAQIAVQSGDVSPVSAAPATAPRKAAPKPPAVKVPAEVTLTVRAMGADRVNGVPTSQYMDPNGRYGFKIADKNGTSATAYLTAETLAAWGVLPGLDAEVEVIIRRKR